MSTFTIVYFFIINILKNILYIIYFFYKYTLIKYIKLILFIYKIKYLYIILIKFQTKFYFFINAYMVSPILDGESATDMLAFLMASIFD